MPFGVELSRRFVLAQRTQGLSNSAFLCRQLPKASLIWSRHRLPVVMSEADAIALTPIFKFRIRELYLKPVKAIRVCALDEVNKKKLGINFRVVELSCGDDIGYAELLALAGHKNMPDFRGVHNEALRRSTARWWMETPNKRQY
jgi:hypothetical protein